MRKCCLSLLLILMTYCIGYGQWRKKFVLPSENQRGLTYINIEYKPDFYIEKLGNQRQLRLKMNITPSTATRLAGAYDFLYRYHNKDYSDNILGKEVFGPISFSVDLHITVMGPINTNKKLVVASDLSSYEIGYVPENTDPKSFIVLIDGLKAVYFRGTEQIDNKIESFLKAEKDATEAAQKKEAEKNKTVAIAKPVSGNTIKSGTEQKNTTSPETQGVKQANQQPTLQTKNGKYYQTKNGVVTEVSKQDYDRMAKEAADNEALLKKEQDEKQLNETLQKIRQDREDQNKIYDEIDKKTGLLRQGLAAGTAVEKARNEIKESTKLKALYASIEELNADFNARIQRMDAAAETMKQQMNAGFAARADMLYSSGSAIDNGFNAASKLIGGFISNARAEKEREKATLELERKKKLAEANLEAERKKMLTELRKELFNKFPKTPLPVASSKIQDNVIYFFVYAFDSSRITEKQAVMHMSNVFPLARYNDGTWPLKSTIEKEINALSPLPKTLHGYYSSREEALAMQNAMKDIYTKTGGTIQTLQYKGRPGVAGASEDTDFWGVKKKDSATKKAPVTSDFWNQ